MTSDITIAGDPFAYPQLSAYHQAQMGLVEPDRGSAGNLAGLARRAALIAADLGSWAPLVRFDAERRWRHRLTQTWDHEVWLLSWLPGQRTGPHDHGGAAAVLTVAAGELTEYSLTGHPDPRRAGTDPPDLTRRVLGVGQSRVFGPNHPHEVANEGDAPAVSVHVYAPTLTETTRRARRRAAGTVAAAAGGRARS